MDFLSLYLCSSCIAIKVPWSSTFPELTPLLKYDGEDFLSCVIKVTLVAVNLGVSTVFLGGDGFLVSLYMA